MKKFLILLFIISAIIIVFKSALAEDVLIARAKGTLDSRYICVPASLITNGPYPIYEHTLQLEISNIMAMDQTNRKTAMTVRLNRAMETPIDYNIWGTPSWYSIGDITNIEAYWMTEEDAMIYVYGQNWSNTYF